MSLTHDSMQGCEMRKLPALRSLQVFEAAARLKHFSKAGEELCITQSAVSRQIKLLEDYFGAALFVRRSRTLQLTEKGSQLSSELENIFNNLSDICQNVAGKSNKEMKLAVFSSFAVKWLIPRLSEFHQLYPQFKIRLEMITQPPNFSLSDADMFITDEHIPVGYWRNMLHQERLIPVCSPIFYDEYRKLGQTELTYFPLLAVDEIPVGLDWHLWSEQHNIALSDNQQIHVFSHILLAIEAAISGLGVALATDFIVQQDIDDGKLMLLDWPDVHTGFSFNLCYKMWKRREPAIKAFSDWLTTKAQSQTSD